jgi:hypothetical protein
LLPATPQAPILAERFRSDNLVVREVRGFSRDRLVVTFDSYAHDLRPDRPGFGEHFLAGHRIDAVHVIPRANDWYQHPEMPAAARLVSEIAADYQRVVAYGSSMGGYAAIRFGCAVGASLALALSPQFSIDPAVVPFETRWAGDSKRLDFALERRWEPAFVERSSSIRTRLIGGTSSCLPAAARLWRSKSPTADIRAQDFWWSWGCCSRRCSPCSMQRWMLIG